MSGVAIEDLLGLWSAELQRSKNRLRPLFSQTSTAESAARFLDGLLGPERRKTGWMRAEAAGDRGPWRQQAILGRGRWEADALRDLVREYAAYVSRNGHAFIDRALYLPKTWTDDPARLSAAHVPPGVTFATKPRLALAMLERAIAAQVPFAWAAADSVYGVGEIETALRRAGKGYVLGVNGSHPFNSWGDEPPVAGTAEEIARALPASAWARLSAGEGTKGPRLHDWACLELADLDPAEYDDGLSGPGTPDLVRWSVQELRRVAVRLAQRRIRPAHVIAWSLWRRAHQAAARRSHLKCRMQL